MTNDEWRRKPECWNDEWGIHENDWLFPSFGSRHSFVLRHSDFVIPLRPLFSSSSLINFICRRIVGLSRICEIVFGKRRVQFVAAAVPGMLNRSFRARRSVIITIAIHELLLNSALIIAG